MTREGEARQLDDLKPHGQMVLSTDGSPVSDMPFDVVDKTVAELREIGFHEVFSADMGSNPRKRGLPPTIGASERESLRKAFHDPAGGASSGDEDEDGYLVDELLDSPASHSSPRSHELERARQKKLLTQQRIEDARIALVHEALTKGVELEGNDLYYEMLGEYPYYQKILSTRKQAISRLGRLAKMQDPSEPRRAKYKFEEKYLTSGQSEVTEVETTVDNEQSVVDKY